MEELIDNIVDIIKDYRKEDLGWLYRVEINKDHVNKWINQFDEDDKEFVLSELLHLLPKSYLTKEDTLRILETEFETLRKDFNYETVKDFLDETRFLDCQEAGKSQKVFLSIVEEILKSKFDYTLAKCGTKEVKNWIYHDDVLASGGTFKSDILKEIHEFGDEKFKDSSIRIITDVTQYWIDSTQIVRIERILTDFCYQDLP